MSDLCVIILKQDKGIQMVGYKTLSKFALLVKKNYRWVTIGAVTDKKAAFEWVAREQQKGLHVRFKEEQYTVVIPRNELTIQDIADIEAQCSTCQSNGTPTHFNCTYDGRKIGHSAGHCTADVCF
jgi:hypothetical protein